MSNQYPHGYPPQRPFPGQAPTQPPPGQYPGGMYPQRPFPGQGPGAPHGRNNMGRPVMNTNYTTALNALKVLATIGVIAYFVLSNFYDMGDIKLQWQSIASAVGTISMLICAVIIVVTAHRMNRAKRAGDRTNMRKPIVSLVVTSIPVLIVGAMAIIGSVQSVADTIEGTETVTVKSCSYSEVRTRSRRSGTSTSYSFKLTLTDGSKHTTRLSGASKATSVYSALYEACADKKGTSSLTLEVYRHSWIIVDARVE
nr:proline-rich domain-containing protein [uncultured Actinomyces sp.]